MALVRFDPLLAVTANCRKPIACFCVAIVAGLFLAEPKSTHAAEKNPRVAAIVTSYYHNSHADVLVSRLFQGHGLDGQGRFPKLELASLYTDQVQTDPTYKDVSRSLAAKYQFPIFDTVEGALTLGTGKLAVDGVLLVAEHGAYPLSPRGQILYPKRRLFEEIVGVFRQSERVVPLFFDKHFADNWKDAKAIYDTAQEMQIPLLAGSCIPLTWRYPAEDVPRNAKLSEILITSFGPIEGYTYHALEAIQALAERRAGGETGVASVECLKNEKVWEAGRRGAYDPKLLAAALSRLKTHPLAKGTRLEERIEEPLLVTIRYRDGLKAQVLVLDYPVVEWAAAWRLADGSKQSTVFWTQEERPLMQFGYQLDGIEKLIHTGKAPWPAERTLVTTGVLAALFESLKTGHKIETPQLEIKYHSEWNFHQPPSPPPGRPLTGQ
jgi:hypothetical protein